MKTRHKIWKGIETQLNIVEGNIILKTHIEIVVMYHFGFGDLEIQ